MASTLISAPLSASLAFLAFWVAAGLKRGPIHCPHSQIAESVAGGYSMPIQTVAVRVRVSARRVDGRGTASL
jgi:hypothetical protein